jgi:hypothetical protein
LLRQHFPHGRELAPGYKNELIHPVKPQSPAIALFHVMVF